MKKTTRKFLAILLTMVMAIGLGVTSFAATDSANATKNVTVQIVKDGVDIYNNTVSVDTDKSSYTTTETNIENYQTAGTAYDALAKVATLGSTKTQYMAQDSEGNWYYIDRWGFMIDSVNGIAATTKDVVIDTDDDGTETHEVTYYYWSLYVNNVYADEYATAYVLDSAAKPVNSVKLVWDSYSYTYTK